MFFLKISAHAETNSSIHTPDEGWLPLDISGRATSTPTISNLIIAEKSFGPNTAPIIPTEFAAKSIFIRATVNHALGCKMIRRGGSIDAWLFRFPEGSCGDECSAHLSHKSCYFRHPTSTQTAHCTDDDATRFEIECRIALPYYARPSDEKGREDDYWSAAIAVTDARGAYTEMRKDFEVVSLKALETDPVTAYGKLNLGGTTEQPQPVAIYNSGNTPLNSITIQGTDLVCKNGGKIPVSAQRFSLSEGTPFEMMTPLVATAPSIITINLPPSTQKTTSSKKIFWKLQAPKKGLNGSCTGTISYIAL